VRFPVSGLQLSETESITCRKRYVMLSKWLRQFMLSKPTVCHSGACIPVSNSTQSCRTSTSTPLFIERQPILAGIGQQMLQLLQRGRRQGDDRAHEGVWLPSIQSSVQRGDRRTLGLAETTGHSSRACWQDSGSSGHSYPGSYTLLRSHPRGSYPRTTVAAPRSADDRSSRSR
jgi:hypothetical protein